MNTKAATTNQQVDSEINNQELHSNDYDTTQSTASNRRLNDQHFKNLTEERGLDRNWVEANCYSGDVKEASKVLGYTAKSGGIIIDTPTQVQVRPDTPWRTDKNKKAPKYRTPLKDDYDASLPINPHDPTYWTDIEKLKKIAYNIDGTPCVLLTEGVLKAIAGCSNGLPTIAVCGVEQGLTSSKNDPQGKRFLVDQIEWLAKHGFGVIIAYDADADTNEHIVNAEKKLAFQLEKMGSPVYSITGTWSEDEGKGMDDYIQANGIEAFREKLVNAELVRDKYKDDGGGKANDKESRLSDKELIEYCRDRLNLRYNEMTREIEIDGEIVSVEPYLYLVDKHDITVGKDKATDIFMMVAKENSYNPVRDYLESLAPKPINITNLASRYFGTNEPLYDLFIEKMLIGAVARAYQPGCKVDTALVLQGNQGVGKSSFFDVLGGEHFDDSMGNGSDKDDLLTFHRSWIQEWGELDRIFGKKAVGEVKGFLSKRRDTFREPYARKTETFPRHSIIVGSVNDASFLNDPTGDRRFWVIPVETNKIDIPLLKQERDQIWAAAVQAYKAGSAWWLSEEEDAQSAANNQQFQIQDEWQATIEDYLGNSDQATVHEILENAFNLSPKEMDKGSQNRVGNILRSMGWKRTRKMINGKRTYIYQAAAPPAPPAPPNKSEVGKAETPSQQAIASPALPALPNSETLTSVTHHAAAGGKHTQDRNQGETGGAGQSNAHHKGNAEVALPQSEGKAGEVVNSQDFSSYPSTRSDDYRHKEKQATKCKEQLLACQTKEDLDKFKADSGFSENQYKWVCHNLLTGKEKARLTAIAKTDQLELTDIPVEKGDIITMAALIGSNTYKGTVTKVEQGNKYLSIKYQLEDVDKEFVTHAQSSSLLAISDRNGKVKWQKN